MSLPLPPKGPSDHDKTDISGHDAPSSPGFSGGKSGAAHDSHLNVTFSGGIRAPSPSLSIISLEDFDSDVRTGRSLRVPFENNSRRWDSRSPLGAPLPSETLKGKLTAFWKSNKGLALVLCSQIFGTLMNVTTRLLEIEGNEGRGYHPFQVAIPIYQPSHSLGHYTDAFVDSICSYGHHCDTIILLYVVQEDRTLPLRHAGSTTTPCCPRTPGLLWSLWHVLYVTLLFNSNPHL
jgi:hypothetical protein